MEIVFGSRKIEKLCNCAKDMRAKLGDRMAGVLQRRLAQLKAADTLAELAEVPGARCHELAGGRKGQLAVTLVEPKRLLFEPDHDPVPSKPDGGFDWARITRIRVVEIVDYH